MKELMKVSSWLWIPALAAAGCALDESSQAVGTDDRIPGIDRAARQICPEPPDVFENALCVCENAGEVGRLVVGPGPEGDRATVGINGFFRMVSFTDIDGDLHAHDGLNATADLQVSGDIASAGDVSFAGILSAGGNLSVGQDLTGVGELSVGDTLRVAGEERVVGTRSVGATGDFAELGLPCACDPDVLFDVAGAVAAARDDNDNEAHGIPTSLASVGSSELVLPTGSYFFEDVSAVGRVRLIADGAVAIYLDGNLDAVGRQQIEVNDGATLDLYVSGQVRTVGNVTAGEGSGSDFRLLVGGDDSVLVSVGRQDFHGAIYAPEAQVGFVGDTTINGSLLARSLASVGDLKIRYSSPGLPDGCDDDDDEDDDEDDDDDDDEDDEDDDGIIIE
jgi:hypothetical protein